MSVDLIEISETIAYTPTKSTRGMHWIDRFKGIHQMLVDLETLATKDGCVAAGWALEFIQVTAEVLKLERAATLSESSEVKP